MVKEIFINMRTFFMLPFILLSQAHAAQVYDLDSSQIEQIIITAPHVRLNLNGQAGTGSQFKIKTNNQNESRGSDWQHKVTKDGKTLKIIILGSDQKEDWGQIVPPLEVQISGAAVKLQMNARDGIVVVDQWNQDLDLQLIRGDVTVKNTQSNLKVTQNRGQFNLNNHIGKCDLDFYNVQSKIQKLKGDLDLRSFQGDASLEQIQGLVDLQIATGQLKAQELSSLRFENNKATLNLAGISGRIDGVSQEGSVQLAIAKSSDVHMKTAKGRIQISGAQQSGAFINLQAEDGELTPPNEIKVYKNGPQKFAKGQLKGADSGVRLNLRTSEGSIVFR